MRWILLMIGTVMLAILTSVAVFAQPTSVTAQRSGIMGNDYQQFTGDMKLGYAMGLFHGLIVATIVVANPDPSLPFTATAATPQPPPGTMLYNCLRGMTNGQVQAILDKYLADHPAEWHHQLADIATNALVLPCAKK